MPSGRASALDCAGMMCASRLAGSVGVGLGPGASPETANLVPTVVSWRYSGAGSSVT
jgi:hypothetical protein